MLGLQHLQLQRHGQPILGTAVADPHQRLATFQHGPAGERLQTIEVGQARRIGIQCPVAPQAWMRSRMSASATRDCGLMPVPMALAT
jgi:hypothetical protein